MIKQRLYYALILYTIYLIQPAWALLTAKSYTIKLQPGYTISHTFTGKTNSEKISNLSFDVSGLLAKLYVNDGSKVKAGQIVAKLDQDRLDLQRQQLIAEQAAIKTDLKLAKKDTERLRVLVRNDHASKQEFDTELNKAERLEANLQRNQAQLKNNALDLQRSILRAPYDASVLQRFVHEGVYIRVGDPIVRIQQNTIDEAYIGIPLTYIHRLNINQCYAMQLENQQRIKGCIKKILHDIEDNTQTIRVLFAIPPQSSRLSGEIVRIELSQFMPLKGAWVPNSALVPGARGTLQLYTLVQQRNSNHYQINTISIKTHQTDGTKSYITGPLRDKMKIIGYGVHKFVPRQMVNVK